MTYQQQGKPIVSELSNHIYGVGSYEVFNPIKNFVPRYRRQQAKRNRKRRIMCIRSELNYQHTYPVI